MFFQEKLELQNDNFDLRSKLKACEDNFNSVKKENEKYLITIAELKNNINLLEKVF